MTDSIKLFVNKLITYLVEGFAFALVFTLLFKKNYNLDKLVVLGLTCAALFGILDYGAPKVADFARQGTGFGLGLNISGVKGLNMPIPPM